MGTSITLWYTLKRLFYVRFTDSIIISYSHSLYDIREADIY